MWSVIKPRILLTSLPRMRLVRKSKQATKKEQAVERKILSNSLNVWSGNAYDESLGNTDLGLFALSLLLIEVKFA